MQLNAKQNNNENNRQPFLPSIAFKVIRKQIETRLKSVFLNFGHAFEISIHTKSLSPIFLLNYSHQVLLLKLNHRHQ